MIGVPTAPGAGSTWHIAVATSTTALATGQACSDLAYTTTGELCTITGSQKECDFPQAALSLPTGGCLQMRGTCTGGTCQPATPFNPNYGLDCHTALSTTDGPAYESAGSGAFDTGHEFDVGPWGISDANAAGRRLSQQYWLAPPTGLARCGGVMVMQNTLGGTGRYDIGLTVSTAAPTAGQSCLDLTYVTTSALCSIQAGQKSCWFPPTATTIPGGACFALSASVGQGAPDAGTSPFNWGASCATN
jgi:hypothetical protein